MALIRIRKGLDLPVAGAPGLDVHAASAPTKVALLGADTVGLRARVFVEPGDQVKRGQPLFVDRRNPKVHHVAPAAGEVVAVNRGERRALVSIVIAPNERERAGRPTGDDFFPLKSYRPFHAATLEREELRALLLESGLWTAFRTRPYGKVPDAEQTPAALFVTAMSTHPLAAPMDKVLEGREKDFERGLSLVRQLTGGPTFLCRAPGTLQGLEVDRVTVAEFAGPHPAGTPGVHIHHLFPAGRDRIVWHVDAQDVAAIGAVARTGHLHVERLVSLGGPAVKAPRLLMTRLGAFLDELVEGALGPGEVRVVSGSLLGGRRAMGPVEGYLGRYHAQVSCLLEGRDRQFLGWAGPGLSRFTTLPVALSRLFLWRKHGFTTSQQGEHRPMVPLGQYERVLPMDLLPTHLLRALAMDDLERAEELGALELIEEDLALCSFVCPGKSDWGAELRRVLDQLEKEG